MCSIFMRKKSKKKGEKPLMSQFSAPISPDVPVKFHPPPSRKREDYIPVGRGFGAGGTPKVKAKGAALDV